MNLDLKGSLNEILGWFTYPARCGCALGNWLAFLVLLLIASFLWSTVVADIE